MPHLPCPGMPPELAHSGSNRQKFPRAGIRTAALLMAGCLGLWAEMGQAASWKMQHQVYIGGVTVLHVDSVMTVDSERYRMQVRARTDGFIGRMVSWKIESGSNGVITADGLRPTRHEQDGEFRGKSRSMKIDYQPDGAIHVTAIPEPEEEERQRVPEELRRGTRDAISSILDALIRAGQRDGSCSGTQAVFDGRRRYDIELIDRGPDSIGKSSYSTFSGPARLCQTRYHPKTPPVRRPAFTGFWRSAPDSTQADSAQRQPIDVWLASPVDGAPMVPVRMASDSGFGALLVHLTGMERVSP